MKVKDILEEFCDNLKEFLEHFGDEKHEPLEEEDDQFYIMICEDGSYYQVDMDRSYWYKEDDGTIVFRVNDS